VLSESFGTSEELQFRIYPYRRINLSAMPPPDAVVITNEHLDHFHLQSLMLLRPGTRILVGDLFPDVCRRAIEECGHVVQTLPDERPVKVKDLAVSLYRCAPASKFWEKRVCHAVISSIHLGSVIIQSDGLVSESLIRDARMGVLGDISLFIATNNAQVPPQGAAGTYENLLPLNAGRPPALGVDIFHEVLCAIPEQVGSIPHLAVCGGGYVQFPAKHGHFRWSDARALQRYLAPLSLAQMVHIPEPGQCLRLRRCGDEIECDVTQSHWVERLDTASSESFVHMESEWFQRSVFGEVSNSEIKDALEQALASLNFLAPILVSTPFGQGVAACHQYVGGPVGGIRFAVRLFNDSPSMMTSFGLDITDAKFFPLEMTEEEVLTSVPFGIDVHIADWNALNEGRLQIWELATARMRQWYMGMDPLFSPIAFFYCLFSEQVRPSLAARMYQHIRSSKLPGI
jgi:hypothetical protein